MSDNNFIDGLIVKAPHEKAPQFVVAKLSIKRDELIDWLEQQEGDWINADIKISKNGKWYASVDDWKPSGDQGESRQQAQRQSPQGRTAERAPTRARQAPPRQAPPVDDDIVPF